MQNHHLHPRVHPSSPASRDEGHGGKQLNPSLEVSVVPEQSGLSMQERPFS